MNFNCIIIEDEPLAQKRLTGYIERIPYLTLSATFDNALDAISSLSSRAIDLVFLDINLGVISGIQLLEISKLTCYVIITTAYEQYALKGFELNVTDYLLKPFTFERFAQAVDKVNQLLKSKKNNELKFIFVKSAYRLERIDLSEILYIEGVRDYRRVYVSDKELMTLKTFRAFEKEIPDRLICRVHRSYMVALDKIVAVENEHIQIGNRLIPLSETYKNRFFELINFSH
jgi:DNA-binding LytR/AlgR family response regulator